MATMAKSTSSSSSTVSTSESESMASVFSSCRILDFADIEEGFSGSDMIRYFVQSKDEHKCHHILDSCYLCKEIIPKNQEIYMYRGELPFCSHECRVEQIEMDLSLERLHQTQLKNQKQNLVPENQNKCSTDMNLCTESGYQNIGYNIVNYVISLVVG